MNSNGNMFEDLVVRHISQLTTGEENDTVESLLKSDNTFRQLYREYKFVWEQAALTDDVVSQDWGSIRSRMGLNISRSRSPFSSLLRVAATLALLISVSSGLWVYWNVPGYGRWVVFETGASADSIVLPDQSIAFLNRNSSLKFINAFKGSERSVKLDGQGYFEVKSDPNKPFNVEAGAVNVRVVGTAFHLDASRHDGIVELNVTKGTVLVKNRVEETPVYAGEWALAGDKVIGKGYAKDQNFLSWKTGVLEFNKASLKEIALALSRHFTEIESFEISGNQTDILVTTRFRSESLDDIIDELGVHFQKNFALENGVLTITD